MSVNRTSCENYSRSLKTLFNVKKIFKSCDPFVVPSIDNVAVLYSCTLLTEDLSHDEIQWV